MAQRNRPVTLSARVKRLADACIENAQNLIGSAEIIMKEDKHNIAFHLAVLALEELGKRSIIIMNGLSQRRGDINVIG